MREKEAISEITILSGNKVSLFGLVGIQLFVGPSDPVRQLSGATLSPIRTIRLFFISGSSDFSPFNLRETSSARASELAEQSLPRSLGLN